MLFSVLRKNELRPVFFRGDDQTISPFITICHRNSCVAAYQRENMVEPSNELMYIVLGLSCCKIVGKRPGSTLSPPVRQARPTMSGPIAQQTGAIVQQVICEKLEDDNT